MDVISETWACQEINDAEYDIEGYQLFRRDHKAGHGGVALYVRNELFATAYDKMSSEFEDSMWCNINLENNNASRCCLPKS